MRQKNLDKMSSNDRHINFSGEEDKHEYGVCFLVHKDMVSAVLGYRLVSSRLISIRLRAAPFNVTIIQDCAPTSGHDDNEVENFCRELQESLTKHLRRTFNSTSPYLDDPLNIDNNFFDSMVNRIYPSELQLNKANVLDAEASFLDLHLSISDGFVKTKFFDKRDDFDFDIVNFPFLDGDVPRSASYGVYISQLIRFARVSSHVHDFNTRNKVLTAKLLRQGYRYHKLRKALSAAF